MRGPKDFRSLKTRGTDILALFHAVKRQFPGYCFDKISSVPIIHNKGLFFDMFLIFALIEAIFKTISVPVTPS